MTELEEKKATRLQLAVHNIESQMQEMRDSGNPAGIVDMLCSTLQLGLDALYEILNPLASACEECAGRVPVVCRSCGRSDGGACGQHRGSRGCAGGV